MIKYLPDIEDGRQYLMLVPMLATLYGRDEPPHRFLRVTPDRGSGRSSVSFYDEPGDPHSFTVVETVDIVTFLEFASYGYSPYVECAFSGFKSGYDFSGHRRFLISQALMRSYESRAKTLLEICERKASSLLTRRCDDTKTGELADELEGVFANWEMLMNTGSVYASNCLAHLPDAMSYSKLPMDKFRSRYDELESRLLVGNHVNMRFKVPEEDRSSLLGAFGVLR